MSCIPDVRILKGDDRTAYRDPAVWYENGTFHLFFTLVETASDKSVFSYVAMVESQGLVHWTTPRKLTLRDGMKDYSSPGNVVADGADRILCFQSYPRPGSSRSRDPLPVVGIARYYVYAEGAREIRLSAKQVPVGETGPVTGKKAFANDRLISVVRFLTEPTRRDGVWEIQLESQLGGNSRHELAGVNPLLFLTKEKVWYDAAER